MNALSPSRPDRPSYGLWSLWEMVVNFRFHAVRLIFTSLHVLVDVSNNNQEAVEKTGGYDNPAYRESKVIQKALREAVIEINTTVALSEQAFADLQSIHIEHAIDGLKRWAELSDKRWSELKARAITMRDAIEN